MENWRSRRGRKERKERPIETLVLTQESLHKILPLHHPPDPELRVAVGDRNSAGLGSIRVQLCFAVLPVLTVTQGTGDSQCAFRRRGGPQCVLSEGQNHLVRCSRSVLSLPSPPLAPFSGMEGGTVSDAGSPVVGGCSKLRRAARAGKLQHDPVPPPGGVLRLPGALMDRGRK